MPTMHPIEVADGERRAGVLWETQGSLEGPCGHGAEAIPAGQPGHVVHRSGAIGMIFSTTFTTLTALIFLLLAGRWLQSKQQRRAMDAAELLYSLAPASARARSVRGRAATRAPAGRAAA